MKAITLKVSHLRRLGAKGGRIADDETQFLNLARRRVTKPGLLTVNNAYVHRNDTDSWEYLIRAQEGFEPIYGALMKPMSCLANETRKSVRACPELAVGRYALLLADLEDLVDVASMVSKNYTELAIKLQQIVFNAEEMVLGEDFKGAVKAAKEYRYLLRYRTERGEPAPTEWYSPLPAATLPSGEDVFRMFQNPLH